MLAAERQSKSPMFTTTKSGVCLSENLILSQPTISIKSIMAAESHLTSNYSKGEVIVIDGKPEEEFPNLPKNTIYMTVKKGSKIRNIIQYALKMIKIESNRHIVFTGCGDAIEKTITCLEITKKKMKKPHQITKISCSRIEEVWEPKNSTLELDRLKVTREIPTIHILLCKDPLDTNEPGYQAPGDFGNGVIAKKRKWNEGRIFRGSPNASSHSESKASDPTNSNSPES